MPKTKEKPQEVNLKDPQYYFNRELSWLEFNNRVLHQAMDPRTPLLERLKFIAIFSSNLDEFFMVRVAILKQQIESEVNQLTPDGRTPQQQWEEIAERLRPLVIQQHHYFEEVLRPLMGEHGIHILNYIDLNQEQRLYFQDYFEKRVFPVLTPLAVDASHPFPRMSGLSGNLGVLVKDPMTGEENFARVKVPGSLPRFMPVPRELQGNREGSILWMGVPMEQVIGHNLEMLFPGMTIEEYAFFRITRDADLDLDEDEAEDLLLAIQQELTKRRFGGDAVRLELQASTPPLIREILLRELNLQEKDVYEIEGLVSLRDLMSFMALPLPDLKDPVWTPVVPPRLQQLRDLVDEDGNFNPQPGEDMFSVLRQGDVLVHHPYESFAASVERFITEAAYDPYVLAIKMTLYRTSGDSPIVNALIAAAGNAKQVSALVEIKARFDEASNITWARKLEQAGVHVVYGLVGLKTHTKIVLIVRQEGDEIRRYVHIGTGNYNPKTAKLYTDVGLFSCRDELGADLTDLFNALTGYSRQRSYRKLLVAPVSLRDRMMALIQREIDHCRQGKPGHIIAKMNSLVDPDIIQMLYRASQAGVQIDLIIRGICCLRPGLNGISDKIRVISIVGRYLEHSRIFSFYNAGQEELYIGSADWMPRNLDRRVEAVTPVEDPHLLQELKTILAILLADNRQAWELQSDGSYLQRQSTEDVPEHNAQAILMERARQEAYGK